MATWIYGANGWYCAMWRVNEKIRQEWVDKGYRVVLSFGKPTEDGTPTGEVKK